MSINKDLITYYNKNKKTHIRIDDIIGIIYGPKTYTFQNVKKCKPWLTLSFILRNRTYDFQMNKYMDILLIRNFIKKINTCKRVNIFNKYDCVCLLFRWELPIKFLISF